MSSDMFSSGKGGKKAYEPWYEKEHRTWLEFRKGCKGRRDAHTGRMTPVCYVMDAKLVCKENGKENCPLWFATHFRERIRRDNDQPVKRPGRKRLA